MASVCSAGARGHPLPRSCLQQRAHPSAQPTGPRLQESFPNTSWNRSFRAGFQSKPSTRWCPCPNGRSCPDGAQVRGSKQTPGNGDGAARDRTSKVGAAGTLSNRNCCLWVNYRSQIDLPPVPARGSPNPGHDRGSRRAGGQLSRGDARLLPGDRAPALPPAPPPLQFPMAAVLWGEGGRRFFAKQPLLTEFEPLNGLKKPRGVQPVPLRPARSPAAGTRLPATARPAAGTPLPTSAASVWQRCRSGRIAPFLFYQGDLCQTPHPTTEFWLTKISLLRSPGPSRCAPPVST